MLDAQSLEWRMACERLKEEATALEAQCEGILCCFDALDREPTSSERDARRKAYLENRSQLHALEDQLVALNRRLRDHEH
jgi:hypothetical protein